MSNRLAKQLETLQKRYPKRSYFIGWVAGRPAIARIFFSRGGARRYTKFVDYEIELGGTN